MQSEMQPATVPIEQMVERLGVRSVFGEPLHEQGVTVIPVAQVAMGFGYGGGYGRTDDEEADAGDGAAPEVRGEGGGGGGGAGGRATPCGYIRISDDGVSYEPIEDKTRIPLAGIMLAAWTVFWVGVTIRTIAKAIAKTRQMKIKRAAA